MPWTAPTSHRSHELVFRAANRWLVSTNVERSSEACEQAVVVKDGVPLVISALTPYYNILRVRHFPSAAYPKKHLAVWQDPQGQMIIAHEYYRKLISACMIDGTIHVYGQTNTGAPGNGIAHDILRDGDFFPQPATPNIVYTAPPNRMAFNNEVVEFAGAHYMVVELSGNLAVFLKSSDRGMTFPTQIGSYASPTGFLGAVSLHAGADCLYMTIARQLGAVDYHSYDASVPVGTITQAYGTVPVRVRFVGGGLAFDEYTIPSDGTILLAPDNPLTIVNATDFNATDFGSGWIGMECHGNQIEHPLPWQHSPHPLRGDGTVANLLSSMFG